MHRIFKYIIFFIVFIFKAEGNIPEMKISCYYDEKEKCFLLIRNKLYIEVSEVVFMEDPEKSVKPVKPFGYKIDFVDGALPLYKEIMIMADVFPQSFPDKKSAEKFIEKLRHLSSGDQPRWIKNCLLKISGTKILGNRKTLQEQIIEGERKRRERQKEN